MEHLASSYQRDALIGDLFEEYQRGRSRLWYWRQAGLAMLYALARWAHRFSFLHRLLNILGVFGRASDAGGGRHF